MVDEIMSYPEFSGAAFVVFLLLAAAALVGYIWLRRSERLRQGQDIEMARLIAYGRKRSLTRPELRFLRNFYLRLNPEERRRLLVNRPFFRERLREYLLARTDAKARARVRFYQKMFPAIDYRLEIIDSSDLQPGEFCTVVGRRRLARLARVEEATHEHVRLRLLEGAGGTEFPEGLVSGIFAYRPLLGEFFLSGRIYESGGHLVLFRYGGRVQARYEVHLMLERVMPVSLRAETPESEKARPESEHAEHAEHADDTTGTRTGDQDARDDGDERGDSAFEGEQDLPSDEETRPGVELVLNGTTDRISDRAMTFRIKTGQDSPAMRRNIAGVELWRLELLLDGSYLLQTRGTLYPARGRGEYLFRFRDMPEKDHMALFEFIRRSGGTRERL